MLLFQPLWKSKVSPSGIDDISREGLYHQYHYYRHVSSYLHRFYILIPHVHHLQRYYLYPDCGLSIYCHRHYTLYILPQV